MMYVCSLCGTSYADPQTDNHPDLECYETLEERVKAQVAILERTRRALAMAGDRVRAYNTNTESEGST